MCATHVCYTVVITYRLSLQWADKASFACWKAFFISYYSEVAVTWKWLVKVSATLSIPSTVPLQAAAKMYVIYALLYERLVYSNHFICVWKENLFLWSNQVKRTILLWLNNTILYEDNKNTWIVAIYFSFGSAFWGRVIVLSSWQSDSTHIE